MRVSAFLPLFLAYSLMSAAAQAQGLSVEQRTVDMDHRILFDAIGQTLDTRCFSKANATLSGADIAWSSDLVYAIDNRMYDKPAGSADLSAIAQLPTQANASARRYILHVDADGVVNATLGKEIRHTDEPTQAWIIADSGGLSRLGVAVEPSGSLAWKSKPRRR